VRLDGTIEVLHTEIVKKGKSRLFGGAPAGGAVPGSPRAVGQQRGGPILPPLSAQFQFD
jgi:hypothetical protein